jgi:hypothetical protein
MTGKPRPLDDFKLSDEEALVLAAAKHWLMARDLKLEKNDKRRAAKRKATEQYRHLMRQTFALERSGEDVPDPDPASIAARLQEPDWAPPFRHLLATCDDRAFISLLRDWDVVRAVLGTVGGRSRSVLLTVELLCFHPWPPKVGFTKGLPKKVLIDMAGAFGSPVGADYVREIDRDITKRTRVLALTLNWKRIALVSVAGIALGAVTGGLGAAAVGTATGGTMGLSGAAAANAGLALLGGGSLAAGGMGVAGGTLVVTGAAGLGAGAAAGGAGAFHAISTGDVLIDMVKLDVLTKYVILREQAEPDKARTVVGLTEEGVRKAEAEVQRLRREVAKLSEVKDIAEAALKKIDELKEQLKTAEASVKLYKAEADALRAQVESYQPELRT